MAHMILPVTANNPNKGKINGVVPDEKYTLGGLLWLCIAFYMHHIHYRQFIRKERVNKKYNSHFLNS